MRPFVNRRHALGKGVVALCVLAVAVIAQDAHAQWYQAGWYYALQLATQWEVESATPPVHWQLDNDDSGTHIRHRMAHSEAGELRAYHWSYNYRDWTVEADQHPLAKMRFDDLMFTCDDGASTVSVSLNLHVGGEWRFDPAAGDVAGTQRGATHVTCQLTPGGAMGLGTWVAGSSDGTPLSSGAFAGLSTDLISGTFVTPVVTVPTNTPVRLEITLLVRIANCCTPDTWVQGVNQIVSFANEGSGPVFNFHDVPANATCDVNSIEANIRNNIWNPPVPTEKSSWGAVKALYR